MRYGILLLCLCLLLSGCGKTEVPAGEPPKPIVCEIPVYDVQMYEYMGGILSGPLYLATIDAPDSVLETGERIPGEQSVPICVFTTIGDTKGNRSSVGKTFWLLDLYDSGITKTYFVNAESSYGSSTGKACYLNSLAKKTSAETPMYLVQSGSFLYMVIGDTAYCTATWDLEYIPEALPELELGDSEIKVVCIE